MSNYNFETLNDRDFEHLVRDLLNAKLRRQKHAIEFHSFPAGKDKGVDLLDSSSEKDNYNWIVQVKHQPSTPYDLFLSQLHKSTRNRRSEIEKIKKLSPNKFILATSKNLTLLNKEDIVEKMTPYLKSLQDIYDRERLNQLLTEFPEVEAAHPKLWFSSVEVFNRIFNNDVKSRGKVLQSDILEKFKLYVPVYSIEKAISMLQRNGLLVITGEPGGGKTTFAEMILHRLIAEGFTSYWIDRSVAEVEKFVQEDDEKLVFYFDDFLGHTRYEIEQGKAQEKGLLHFLRNLRGIKNKFFILTTRTALINEAALESERFRRSDLYKEQYEIKVKSLTTDVKVEMIKNHLSVRHVPESFVLSLANQQILSIATHKNFSPRIIEFVTTSDNYNNTDPSTYYQYIIKQLDNPNEVWLHAYEQQLNDYDRFFLTTVYSFRGSVNEADLEIAYRMRLDYEISINHIPRTVDTFKNSFRKLLGSFVVFKLFSEEERLDFINPSVEDFLNFYLDTKDAEKLRIAESVAFVEQVYRRFRVSGAGYLLIHPSSLFRNRLLASDLATTEDIATPKRSSFLALYSSMLTYMFFKNDEDVKSVIQQLKKINWRKVVDINYAHLYGFLEVAASNNVLKKYITERFDQIIRALYISCRSIDDLLTTKKIFEAFERDYTVFISNTEIRNKLKNFVDYFLDDELANISETLRETATSLDTVLEEANRLKMKIGKIYNYIGFDDEVNLRYFNLNWEAICDNNLFIQQMILDDEKRGPIRSNNDD